MIILLAFLVPLIAATTIQPTVNNDLSCDEPENVEKTGETGTTISFSWDACNCGETSYKLYYWKDGESNPGPDNFTTNTNFTFTGLSAGDYSFYIHTVCGAQTSTAFIVIDEINGF